jgi:putative ABC transport system permease protein
MFRNYLLVAVRNMARQRLYSTINIAGLAVAIASVVLIALFVKYEFSYDKHFTNSDRIFRIPTTLGSYHTKDSPLPLASTLSNQFPDVEAVTRLFWMEPPHPFISLDEENKFQEKKAYYADSSFFNVFKIDLISGSTKSALAQPQSIVLSSSTAKRYFNDENPLNKVLRLNNSTDLKVTGVFQDFPANTHIHPDMLISATTNALMLDNSAANWDWLYANVTYVKLRSGADADKLNSTLKELFWEVTGNKKEEYNADYTMQLQPIVDIHLLSDYAGENNGSLSTIYTFGTIGFVIILIATINFMNLSTVRSLKRAREVGMRKVLGGHRIHLIFQFLNESIATVLVSTVFAVALAAFALQSFNTLIGTSLTLSILWSTETILSLLIFALLLGLLSGLYPAFFLSGQNPSHVLKGKFSHQKNPARLRKALVMLQFAIGFAVLVGTFIVNSQLDFMIHKDLGYKKNNIITIELPPDSIGIDRIRDEISRLPNVAVVSKMSESFNNVQGWLIPWYEGAPPTRDFSVTRFHTDSYFKELAGLTLVAGRFFNQDFRGDSANYVLNEAAIKKLGWTNENALGRAFGSEEMPGRVIGVVQNFNFRHLATPISPFIFFPPSKRVDRYEKGRLAIRVEGEDYLAGVEAIERRWRELVPQWPLKYSFMETDLDTQYQIEAKLSSLIGVFSMLALLVSSLGLFGIASFSITQRTKEIGIRKILGADVHSLVFVTTKDFIFLVLIGICSGVPIAYLAASQWLNSYAYRVDISALPFITAFTISLLIAAITVVSVSLKASISNPVESLRHE